MNLSKPSRSPRQIRFDRRFDAVIAVVLNIALLGYLIIAASSPAARRGHEPAWRYRTATHSPDRVDW